MKRYTLLIVLLAGVWGCGGKSETYSICGQHGTVRDTATIQNARYAISSRSGGEVACRLQFVHEVGHFLYVHIVPAKGGEEIGPVRIGLFDEDEERQERVSAGQWRERLRKNRKWSMSGLRELKTEELKRGESADGVLVFKEHHPSSWILARVQLGREEHLFVFRKDSGDPCLPDNLPMGLYNLLIEARQEK